MSAATASDLPRRGSFITLEGGEGVGKSTQALRLVERLGRAGIEAIATREPGGSPGAEILRDLLLSGMIKDLGPKAEAILFAAARIDHIDRKIAPALALGTWVVSDRFADSTRAYQGALGGLDAGFHAALERVTLGEIRPDLTLILDLPAKIGLARAAIGAARISHRIGSKARPSPSTRLCATPISTIAAAEPATLRRRRRCAE